MDNEKLLEIEEKFQQSRLIENQLQFIEQQISELKELRDTLGALSNSKRGEILSSVGKGTFVKASLKDEKLFVDVGAGIMVRKTPKEANEIIEEQMGRINEINFQLNSKLEELNSELEDFVSKIEQNSESS